MAGRELLDLTTSVRFTPSRPYSSGIMRSKLIRMSRRFLIVRQLVRFQPDASIFGTVAEW